MSFLDKVSLQLYTVREEAAKDFIGTIEKVAEIGYKGVEFAGFFDTPATELKAALDRLSLVPVASHTPLQLLKDDLDHVLAYNKEIGAKYIVCPFARIDTWEELNELAELLNRISPKIRDAGMGVGYHNHSHEFIKYDGKYGLDILMERTKEAGVFPQIDVFWVEFAGLNAVEYISKYKSRCPVIHLKDMKHREEQEFAEVGEGILDMKAIITKGLEMGAEYFTVEQDRTDKPELESAKISYQNLKAIAQELNI
jgi:sugar phosphate isomerase/epimerase